MSRHGRPGREIVPVVGKVVVTTAAIADLIAVWWQIQAGNDLAAMGLIAAPVLSGGIVTALYLSERP